MKNEKTQHRASLGSNMRAAQARMFLAFSMILMVLCLSMPVMAAETETAWHNFVAELDGVSYALPCELGSLQADGWEMDDTSDILEPNTYSIVYLKKGDNKVAAYMVNLGIDDKAVSDCLVGGISQSQYDIRSEGAPIRCAGFALGDGIDALLESWGEPTRRYDGTSSGSLTYSMDYYEEVKVSFDMENKTITEIDIRNYVAPDGYNDAAYAAEVTVPACVTDYQAPEKIGDSLDSFTLRLKDTVYQFPMPVAEMGKNGWALNGEPHAPKIAAHDSEFGWKLQHGAQALESVSLTNDSTTANLPENCMVTGFRISSESGWDYELPGGITKASTKEDIEAALEDLEFETDESASLFYYELEVEDENGAERSLEIVWNTENESIQSITYRYWD